MVLTPGIYRLPLAANGSHAGYIPPPSRCKWFSRRVYTASLSLRLVQEQEAAEYELALPGCPPIIMKNDQYGNARDPHAWEEYEGLEYRTSSMTEEEQLRAAIELSTAVHQTSAGIDR
eukprot:134155-Prorocentrum_minimum.AAC.1